MSRTSLNENSVCVAHSGLAYRQWGEGGNRPILLLHGFMGSSRDWQPIAESLSRTHWVIAPDLPGHGCSHFAEPQQFTMQNAARLVVQLLDELKIKRCACLGYSMGGRTALYLAVHYPSRFERVILESASPGLHTEQERALRRRWDANIAERLEVEPFQLFLESWYQMGLFDSFRAHKRFEQAFERRLDNDPAQLAISMRQMGTGSMPSLWGGWRQVENVVLIVGAFDQKYVGISAEMLTLNPTTVRHVLSQAGHNTHFEQPAQFLLLIQPHLTNKPL